MSPGHFAQSYAEARERSLAAYDALPQAEFTDCAIEFGTLPVMQAMADW